MVKFTKKQQGTQIVEPPKMPIQPVSPLNQFGIDTNKVRLPQTETSTTNDTAVNPNLFKGVDISKSFKNTDFANAKDYEQAKRRSESYNLSSAGIAKSQMNTAKQEGEVAKIIQQQRMASLDPNLLNQANQLGTSPLPQAQQAGLNVGEALKAAGIEASATAGAGALTGAAAGLIGGPAAPITSTGAAAAGGAIGGITGLVHGFVRNLQQQRGKQIQANFIDLSATNRNLRYITSDQNAGGDASENLASFNEQLAQVDQAYSNLVQINRNKPMGQNDEVELARFGDWYAAGGAREHWINEMQQAVYNPNPSKVLLTPEDYTDATAQ